MSDYERFVRAARDYYTRGLLAAQNKEEVGNNCRYTYPDVQFRCAIGAGLTKTELREINQKELQGATLPQLRFLDLSIQERINLTNLQQAHDGWVQYFKADGEERFLAKLTKLEATLVQKN